MNGIKLYYIKICHSRFSIELEVSSNGTIISGCVFFRRKKRPYDLTQKKVDWSEERLF